MPGSFVRKEGIVVAVFCTFRTAGFHRWPGAPNHAAYLRDSHRHEFHVKVHCLVEHNERDVEFIAFKHYARQRFQELSLGFLFSHFDFGDASCETLATNLWGALRGDGYKVIRVEVSEDGENGAVISE